MTRLKQTVMGPYAPDDPHVFWVDTSDITAPTIKINLNGAWVALGGESSEPVQADWNQANSSEPDYIKNKPTIPKVYVVDVTVSGNIFYATGLNDAVVMQRMAAGEITIIHWQDDDEDFYSIIQTGANGGNCEAYNPRTQRYINLD